MAIPEGIHSEECWNAEVVPIELGYLARNLRSHFELDASDVGTRGDTNHRKGYHRSRRWILDSRYCTNRTYSVMENEQNAHGGNINWVSALDLSLPTRLLLPACQRLDIAVRSGRLEKVAEWYGNTDGDSRVDGYNNIYNRIATADNSHLWHVHISLLRGHANDNHADLFSVLTGVGWDAADWPTPTRPPTSMEWTEEMIRNLPTLHMGSTGAHVRTAQGLLCARGFRVAIDGTFGPDMHAKTVAMQRQYGAEHIDGWWGPETWTIGATGTDQR